MIPTSISGDTTREVPLPFIGTLGEAKRRAFDKICERYNTNKFYERSVFACVLENLKKFIESEFKKNKKFTQEMKYSDIKTPIKYKELFTGRIYHDYCIRVYIVVSNEFGIGVSTGCFLGGGNPYTIYPLSKLQDIANNCRADHSDYALLCNGM